VKWSYCIMKYIYIQFKQVFLLLFSELVDLLCWCFISETRRLAFHKGLLLVSLYGYVTFFAAVLIHCRSYSTRCYSTAFVLWTRDYTNLQVSNTILCSMKKWSSSWVNSSLIVELPRNQWKMPDSIMFSI